MDMSPAPENPATVRFLFSIQVSATPEFHSVEEIEEYLAS